MKSVALFLLVLLLCLSAVACSFIEDGPCITFAESGILTLRQSTKEAGSLTLPAPAGMHAAFCVGWQATTENGTVFLPIGATYQYKAEEDLTFAPVYLHLTTRTDAAVDTDTTSLVFTTSFHQTEWESLQALDSTAACGTLILPVADIAVLDGVLTHDALAANEKTAADVAAAFESEAHTFSGALALTEVQHLTTKYTAVGYAKITYSDGTTRYAYAAYENDRAPNASLLSFTPMQSTLSLITDTNFMLDPETGAIHVITSIPADKWQALFPQILTLDRGTLFATAEELEQTDGILTHAALIAAGCTPTDIPAQDWCRQEEGKLYFKGILNNIKPYARLQKHSAVGYLKITYPDQSYIYVYAMHEGERPLLSVQQMADNAKNDLSDTQTDTHPYAAGDRFSPYTANEQACLNDLATVPLLLLFDSGTPSKKKLPDEYKAYFSEYTVQFKNSAWNDETDEIWKAIADIEYWGGAALVITLNDGTPITEELLGTITLQNGSITARVTEYICHNGKLILPHSNFITP
ncbi:MAG: hypothetical protein E7639_00780 [Ruminococcaceae bacterium]|nr:hypothetical protein [Oscillospiraceae bacterium]